MLVLQRQFNPSVRRVDGSIAAGQAVASAVYQLLDLGDAPFRDLDIFWMNVENTPKKTIYPDYQKLEWFANNADEKTLYLKPNRHKAIESIAKQKLTYSSSFACYGLGVMSVGSYFIKDTFMDSTNKRLNHVLTSLNHESTLAGRISNASATIRNFDINCCQVALELETMTLVASDAFVEFLTTKALKVVNYNTTMHSAVRLDKKSKDIAFASVDMDSELASLQTLRQLVVEVENSRKQNGDRYWPLYGNAFSDVYFERYKASSDVIQRAFSIDAETFDFGNFYEKQTDDGSYAGGIHRPEKKTLFFLTPTHYDADFIDAAKTLIPILPHMTDANPLMLFIPVIEAIQAQPALRDTLKWINDGIDLHSHYEVVSKEIVALHLRDDLDAPVELMIASITSIIDFSKALNRYPRGVNTDLFFNLLHHAKNFKELGNVETLYTRNEMNTHDFTAALNRPNSAFANQVLIVLQRHFNHTVQRVDGSIAAGQAVASAVYQLLGLGEAPFRDLDIFWTETENTPTDKTRPDYQKIEFKDGDQGGVFYVKPEKHKPVNHELKTELTYSPSLAYYGLGAMTVGSYVIKDTFMDAANQRINHILTSLTPHSGLETKNRQCACYHSKF